MAVTSGFFDSRNGDRKYNADQMSEYFRGIVSGGVFQHLDGGLQVTAGTGLSVNVAAGRAIVQNRWIQNSASLPLSISAASETYGRKDAVVLRLDSSARTVSIVVKTGTPAASPAAPSMTRSGGVYEMALAYVNVAAGATTVTVTDKRSNSAVCGWATVAQATSGEVDQMLDDMKTGFDGVEYPSPAAMVQGCDQKLQGEIDALPTMEYANFIYSKCGYWIKPDGVVQTIQQGVIDFKTGNSYGTHNYYKHIELSVSSYVGKYITVTGHSRTVSSHVNYGLYGFFDSSNNLLDSFGASDTTYKYIIAKVPEGATKIIINGDGTDNSPAFYTNEAYNAEMIQKAYNYAVTDEHDESSHLFVTNMPEYVTGGVMNFNTNTTYGSSYGKKFTVSPGDLCIISGQTNSISGSLNYNLYGFYDSSMNLLLVSTYTSSNTVYSNVRVTAPENAAYCYVNGTSVTDCTLYVETTESIKSYVDAHAGLSSIWSGKRIGVLGTSVAFGALATTSYSYEAAQRLGFELSMFGVPGLAIETASDGSPKTYGSFTLSKAEYTSAGWSIPNAPVTPYVPGGSYNNYYRTYENVFVEDNADIDLWVYAVVPNNNNFDLDDWNAFNKSGWKYNDDSAFSEHRKTFIGALLFIMNQMYVLNPDARMVFVVDSSFSYSGGLSNLELISEQWNIPIIDLWGKINTSPKSLIKLKSEGGTNDHPSTFAHQIMGRMLSGDLESVS